MSRQHRAWLLASGTEFAVAERHMVEYVLSPHIVDVPLRPPHCAGVAIWRERWIPVLDLAAANASPTDGHTARAIVLAYQLAPGQPLQHGAVAVHAPPRETWVSDDMACAPPEDLIKRLRQSLVSCFSLHGTPVPIVNVARLFSLSPNSV